MNRGNLIVMIGLPASGKDTYANKLKKELGDNCVIISSDELRIELFGNVNDVSNNPKIFSVMKERSKKLLLEGKTVIFNATNISEKRRISLLKHELNGCYKRAYAYVMVTPYEECIERDKKRYKKVGENVITRMYKTFCVPNYYEGWDNIFLIYDGVKLFNETISLINIKTFEDFYRNVRELNSCLNFKQNNKYHKEDLITHSYLVLLDLVRHNYPPEISNLLYLVAIYHDIGKPFCEIKDKNGLSHYNNHANVSAYETLVLGCKYNLTSNNQELLNICSIILYHMKPYDKNFEEIKSKIGNLLFNLIKIFNNSDGIGIIK